MVRHGPKFYNCHMELVKGNLYKENEHQSLGETAQEIAIVRLSEDDQGLAAGQYVAFYKGNTCLGSGIIIDSWGDNNFPVSSKALEIARMKDKSELREPVKIKNLSDNTSKVKPNNGKISSQVEVLNSAKFLSN